MAKLLIIAEKPSVMRDIQKVYRGMKNYEHELVFASFVGHVVEGYNPEDYDSNLKKWSFDTLPILPEQMKYKPSSKTKDVYNDLKKKLADKSLDGIISATDAGREGELIYWAFDDTINHNLPVYRYWASDSTEASVEKALRNLIEPNNKDVKNLELAARLRAEFDWLVGMNFSRAASLKANSLLPLGRVQTPTLKILVDRELAIQNFKPEPFFELVGDFDSYLGAWFDETTNAKRFDKKEDAEAVVERLQGHTEGIVVEVEKKERKSTAPTLHSLLELQKEAGKAFGLSAKEVLDIAQFLYEERKLITYPRTDSRHIPKSMASEITKHIESLVELPTLGDYAKNILNDTGHVKKIMGMKRYVDDKKVTDHHAILPTNIKANLQQLNEKQKNVYLLIVRRFLSIFMPPQIVDETNIITKVDNDVFQTKGSIVKDKGFKVLYEGVFRDKKDVELPNLSKGDSVKFNGIELIEKETTPPKRFDDPDLLTAMSNVGNQIDEEELKDILKDVAGLGTSATRAGIVENLIQRKWVTRKGKTLIPTEKGIQIIQILGEREITSPKLTAVWESKLQDVEAGNMTYDEFKNEMFEFIKTNTKELSQNIAYVGDAEQKQREAVGSCPKCNHDVIDGKSYYLCSEYSKTCDFVIPKKFANANITKTDMKKLLKNERTNNKKFTFKSGKKGEYPLELNDEYRLNIYFGERVESEVIGKCPKCQADFEFGYISKCSNNGKSCDFSFVQKLMGIELSKEDALQLISGEKTEVKDLTFKSGKTGRGQIYFDSNFQLKIEFENSSSTSNKSTSNEVVGKCPKCNGSVYARNYFMCENYKNTCDFIFGKVFGAELTKEDAKVLLNGGETKPKQLTFKSGKTSESTIVIKNGKVVPSFFD